MSFLSLASPADKLSWPRWLPLLLIVVGAVMLRTHTLSNVDVSWGLTAAERLLDGHPFDFEVNPPNVYLYVVPVWIGRTFGLSEEYCVDALVMLSAAFSLWLAGGIVRRGGIALADGWAVAALAAAAILILPARTFGEREHIGVIAMVPLLAVAVLRADARKPDIAAVIAAGLGGGVATIIKPYFAIAIVCMALTAALHRRSLRTFLAPENWIAAAMLGLYVVAFAALHPDYVANVVPMVMAIYVPAHMPAPVMLVYVATPLWVAATAATLLLERGGVRKPAMSVIMAASFGFFVMFWLQQKGWPYHSYPMLTFACIALMSAVLSRLRREPLPGLRERFTRYGFALASSVLVLLSFAWLNAEQDSTAIADDIRAIKPHPTIITMSDMLGAGFPLTRLIGAIWVGRTPNLWINGDIFYQRAHRTLDAQTEAKFDAYAEIGQTVFTEDVTRNRPDIILVDRRREIDWIAWAQSYPPLKAELAHYALARSVEGFDILARKAGE